MISPAWVEVIVGFALVVASCSIVGRPRCQSSRLIMGMAGAALLIGIVGVAAGVNDLAST